MEVTIYSTSMCAACHTLTKWLESKNIKYTKKVTDENQDYMNEFMSLNDGMIGVPFTVIKNGDETVAKISGYDQKKFTEALNI